MTQFIFNTLLVTLGATALTALTTWLWWRNAHVSWLYQNQKLNTTVNTLQQERSKLIKNANELQSEAEHHAKIIHDLNHQLKQQNDLISQLETEVTELRTL